MQAPSALIRGIVSRLLPAANQDSPQIDVPTRYSRYGESAVLSYVRKSHLLAEEGSYFIANNNGQTGILSSAATGFVATTPALVIVNTDNPLNAGAKSTYVDVLKLVTTVVGSAASGLVNLQGCLYLDAGNRYSSGGTTLILTSPNGNMGQTPASVTKAYFGAITATAATAAARCIDPLFTVRPSVSGTVLDVVGETKQFNFGAVENTMNGSITAANANNIPVPTMPLIIGPGQSGLLYLWQNLGGTNVAATYAPNLGWWER